MIAAIPTDAVFAEGRLEALADNQHPIITHTIPLSTGGDGHFTTEVCGVVV